MSGVLFFPQFITLPEGGSLVIGGQPSALYSCTSCQGFIQPAPDGLIFYRSAQAQPITFADDGSTFDPADEAHRMAAGFAGRELAIDGEVICQGCAEAGWLPELQLWEASLQLQQSGEYVARPPVG